MYPVLGPWIFVGGTKIVPWIWKTTKLVWSCMFGPSIMHGFCEGDSSLSMHVIFGMIVLSPWDLRPPSPLVFLVGRYVNWGFLWLLLLVDDVNKIRWTHHKDAACSLECRVVGCVVDTWDRHLLVIVLGHITLWERERGGEERERNSNGDVNLGQTSCVGCCVGRSSGDARK